MRIGAHWGDVMWTGHDLIGHHVNLAARLLDLARPGEVLVTSELRQAAGDVALVRYGRPCKRAVKGVRQPVEVSVARHREEA